MARIFSNEELYFDKIVSADDNNDTIDNDADGSQIPSLELAVENTDVDENAGVVEVPSQRRSPFAAAVAEAYPAVGVGTEDRSKPVEFKFATTTTGTTSTTSAATTTVGIHQVCQCYKTLFSLTVAMKKNKLECLNPARKPVQRETINRLSTKVGSSLTSKCQSRIEIIVREKYSSLFGFFPNDTKENKLECLSLESIFRLV